MPKSRFTTLRSEEWFNRTRRAVTEDPARLGYLISEMPFGKLRREYLLRLVGLTGRIWLHCEGGLGLEDPDIKKLINQKRLVVKRTKGLPKWSKEFQRLAGRSMHSTDQIRRSYVVAA